MKLEVTRSFSGRSEDLRERLTAMEQRLRTKYHADTEWIDANTMKIGAPGARGQVEIGTGTLTVRLELSAVLRPLRARIERELGREIEQVVEPIAEAS